MSLRNPRSEVESPEKNSHKPENSNPETHKKHGGELENNNRIGKQPEKNDTPTDYASKMKSIEDRAKKSHETCESLRGQDALDKKDRLAADKAFEDNKPALQDIKDMRSDIEKSQAELYDKQSKLDNTDPQFEEKYKALADQYKELEDYKGKLSDCESKLLGNSDYFRNVSYDSLDTSGKVNALEDKIKGSEDTVGTLRYNFHKNGGFDKDDFSTAENTLEKNKDISKNIDDLKSDIAQRKDEINKELGALDKDNKQDRVKERELVNERKDLTACEAKLDECAKKLSNNNDVLKDVSHNASFEFSDKLRSFENKAEDRVNDSQKTVDALKGKEAYKDKDRETASKAITENKEMLNNIENARGDIEKKDAELSKAQKALDLEKPEDKEKFHSLAQQREVLESHKNKLDEYESKLKDHNDSLKEVSYDSLGVSEKMNVLQDRAQESGATLDSLLENKDLAGESSAKDDFSRDEKLDSAIKLYDEMNAKLETVKDNPAEYSKIMSEYVPKITEANNQFRGEKTDGSAEETKENDKKKYCTDDEQAKAAKCIEQNKETLSDITKAGIEIDKELSKVYVEKSTLDMDSRSGIKKGKELDEKREQLEAQKEKLKDLESKLLSDNKKFEEITEAPSIPKDIEDRMKDIGKRVEAAKSEGNDLMRKDAAQHGQADGEKYKPAQDNYEAKKMLGSNCLALNDIYDLKKDVSARMEDIFKQTAEMRAAGEYDKTKYDALAKEYKLLESYYNKLNSYEGDLEGKNYAVSEMVKIPYLQQSDNFRYHENGAVGAVNDYVTALEKKINSGETTLSDRVFTDFQKEKVYDALESAPDKEKAAELLSRFEKCRDKLAGDYSNIQLMNDGRVMDEKGSKAFMLGFKNTSSKKAGNMEKITESEYALLKANLSKSREYLLYTGEYTGKSTHSLEATTLSKKRTDTTIERDADGKEKSKQTRTEEYSAAKLKAQASMDILEGRFSASVNTDIANAMMSYENQRGDVKTKDVFEATAFRGGFSAEGDAKKLNAGVSAYHEEGSIKSTSAKELNGDAVSVEVSGSLNSERVEAGISEKGPRAEAKHTVGNVDVKFQLNDETLFSKSGIENLVKGDASPKSLVERFQDGLDKAKTAVNILTDHNRAKKNFENDKANSVEAYNEQALKEARQAQKRLLEENDSI